MTINGKNLYLRALKTVLKGRKRNSNPSIRALLINCKTVKQDCKTVKNEFTKEKTSSDQQKLRLDQYQSKRT